MGFKTQCCWWSVCVRCPDVKTNQPFRANIEKKFGSSAAQQTFHQQPTEVPQHSSQFFILLPSPWHKATIFATMFVKNPPPLTSVQLDITSTIKQRNNYDKKRIKSRNARCQHIAFRVWFFMTSFIPLYQCLSFFANSNTLQRICEVDFKLLLHETCGRFI